MSKKVTIIIVAVAAALFCLIATPGGRKVINRWMASLTEADIETSYEIQKNIEDTLRSYASSYAADKITYETNKNLESAECQQLATAAFIRANRTAAVYNEYYLKNKHVWKDNVPYDIKDELPYITPEAK